MSLKNSMTRFLSLLLLCGPVLAGCAGEGTKGVAEMAGLATTPQESKPFVKATRSPTADYIPVGSTVTRAAPRKKVEDFKKLEAELEAKRLSNEAAGGQAKSLGTTQPPAPAKVPTN